MKKFLKKFTVFMLLAVMAITSVPASCAEAASPALIVSQAVFTDLYGNVYENLTNNTNVNVCVTVKGVTDGSVKAKLIAAYYEYGLLKDLNSSEQVTVSGKTTQTLYADITTGLHADKGDIRVFVWESYEGNGILSNSGTFGSDDASVSDILVGGMPIEGFDSDISDYSIKLPASYITYPDIDVITRDLACSVTLVKDEFPGNVRVMVSSSDGSDSCEYSLSFVKDEPVLSNVKMHFGSTTKEVTAIDTNVSEPKFIDNTLTGTDYYAISNVKSKTNLIGDRETYLINIPKELIGSTIISGSQSDSKPNSTYVQDGANPKLMTFDITGNAEVYYFLYATSPSYNNIAWAEAAGFEPTNLSINWVEGAGAAPIAPKTNLVLYKKEFFLNGKEKETVTIGGQQGLFTCPSVIIKWKGAEDYAALEDITLDGVSLDNFDPSVTEYDITLPYTATGMPEVSGVSFPDSAIVTVNYDEINLKATVNVKSKSGNVDITYTLNFTIPPNPEKQAEIVEIRIDGTVYDKFDKDVSEYTYELAEGVTTIPEVTALASTNLASVEISTEDKVTTIKVTSMDGTASKTYKITFKIKEPDKISNIQFKSFNPSATAAPYYNIVNVPSENVITTGVTGNFAAITTLSGGYPYFNPVPSYLANADFIRLDRAWGGGATKAYRTNANNPNSQNAQSEVLTFDITKSANIYYVPLMNTFSNTDKFCKWLNDESWEQCTGTATFVEAAKTTACVIFKKAVTVTQGETVTVKIGGFANNYFVPFVFIEWVE